MDKYQDTAAFAMSTWRKVKEFQQGVRALEKRLPMHEVRNYLASGRRDASMPADIYDEIDRLKELRAQGIRGGNALRPGPGQAPRSYSFSGDTGGLFPHGDAAPGPSSEGPQPGHLPPLHLAAGGGKFSHPLRAFCNQIDIKSLPFCHDFSGELVYHGDKGVMSHETPIPFSFSGRGFGPEPCRLHPHRGGGSHTAVLPGGFPSSRLPHTGALRPGRAFL